MADETPTPPTAIVPHALPREATFSLVPRSFQELETVAVRIAESGLVPASLKGKPSDCMIAMETLRTLGLNPIAGLQGVQVLNGRVSLFGEWWLGLIQSSPVFGGQAETWDDATGTATVTFIRRGIPTPFVGSFSREEATKAGLMGKETYKAYARDMITWRARHRAGSAAFSDILHGILPTVIAGDWPVATVDVETTRAPIAPVYRKSAAKVLPDSVTQEAEIVSEEEVDALVARIGAEDPGPVDFPAPAPEPAAQVQAPAAPAPAVQAPAPIAGGNPSLFEETPAAPETHTVRSVSATSAQGGKGREYTIVLGDERTFKTRDAGLFRAAAAAEAGRYPVRVMLTGGQITVIAPVEATKAKG